MTTRTRPSRRRLHAVALALALAALVPAVIAAPGAVAAPPTADGPTAAAYGARWAATKVNAAGFVANPDASPNVAATVETALGLAFTRTDVATFERIMGWLRANAATAVLDPNGNPGAGQIGYLLMLAHVAGDDPASFGGVDLVAALGATLGDFAPGLYGESDPTYDGAFRQSVALLGLTAVGVTPPAAAVQWLVDQQCDAPVAAAGGWQPYRVDTAAPCDPPDPNAFTGPDTNSTALAVQALDRVGPPAAVSAGLDFLAAAQAAGGGFAFVTGGDPDPNSTALVVMAIVAGGEDPAAGRWAQGSGALGALLAWQLGCDRPADEVGAFSSPFSGGAPDAFATRQAVWGASGQAFPPATGTFAASPVPCVAPTTSTSTTTSTTAVVVPAPLAPIVTGGPTGGAVVPAFTG